MVALPMFPRVKLKPNRRPFLFALALLFASPSAFAYIDPGSGMLLWQGLIAAVGAVLVFVRQPWKTIKGWVSRLIRR